MNRFDYTYLWVGSLFLWLLTTSSALAQTAPNIPLPAKLPAYKLPARPSFFTEPTEAGAAAITEGLVVDDSGRPVAGAVCWIRGSRLAVFTGPDGRYRLPVPARCLSRRGRVRITLSGVGFVGQVLQLDAWQAEQPVLLLPVDTRPLH
ncbi:carboxypeptidase regulatory-like domain-containing protein [Hymenobacter sp. ISL-91]|uniref:carboxypeptidase-like regulatory domain-containing protein n=1 Tax=Hymenobacter sp. ISL-91 TaxID=2819151 RepID=UPI001BE8782E|nr:carboxypeptidase-like regulatory domain-containing protein [Hymenobacter sp. ISL-91]MBT2556533.1 carboxypeptidase regulatory-like domain-containing protein [Hymenobacter sp. ISL-91]